ncbi:MAG: histidinol phosphate phosphatase [Rickettsiaceae bacterium]|jgi:inositol-phosphate phosphatase/L-galactose 1-phosphate phosphatase/histidinol-phosphatase|nr:histidinol phosphate phosphatase [Rickettsiaceae bacterium]
MNNQELIDFGNYLADISSEVIRKYFRQDFAEIKKDDQTPVTKADKETELVLREAITKKFPDHGIIGEEFGHFNENAKYKWVLDPIDGTISFVIGRPIFGTLISLCFEDKPILGVINQPISGERWIGIAGGEATLNGKKIKTKNCTDLNQAIFCSTSPFFFKGKDLEIINKISSQTKYQSQGGIIYGGDCYLFGLLALGQVDIIIERGLKNFDFSALIPIVEAAGGIVTDWKGRELNLNSDGTILACGDKGIHSKILEIFSQV